MPQPLGQAFYPLHDQLSIRMIECCQQLADPVGLIILIGADFGQKFGCLAAKNRGELNEPRNIRHDDASLNARNRLASNTKPLGDFFLRQSTTHTLARNHSPNRDRQLIQVNFRHDFHPGQPEWLNINLLT
jgi:hypothetical protein